ncbi:MAG: DUF4278 domain-containing protein [Microcoleus sp. SIO2G3]|nr:DUF4278 domain-containing protein [Microcoleus sp. SIO2G3]
MMKLRYRGNSYESHPQVIETHDTGITAKYRGLTYQVHRPLASTCPQPPVNLKYRGMAYTRGQVPAIKSRSQPSTSLIHV